MKTAAFFLSSFLCATTAVWAEEPPQLGISFGAVGTADVIGPNQIHSPEFVAPVVEYIFVPNGAACLSTLHGQYESKIDQGGKQSGIHSMNEPINGNECERHYLFPALARWQFKPARLSDKPTAVYFRYWLNSGNVQAQ